jgi:6-pyruvoyltetrahydropterin/6-carboxytetrahydropterin synthase
MYGVTKTYGHELGLSACFRQHRATSHCRFLHGYALSFSFEFVARTLDSRNWVIDFGGLKPLKQWLVDTFDHRLLVAEDDPYKRFIEGLGQVSWDDPGHDQLANVLVVPAVGCEAFAEMAWNRAKQLLDEWQAREVDPLSSGVTLVRVECREHAANAASFCGNY